CLMAGEVPAAAGASAQPEGEPHVRHPTDLPKSDQAADRGSRTARQPARGLRRPRPGADRRADRPPPAHRRGNRAAYRNRGGPVLPDAPAAPRSPRPGTRRRCPGRTPRAGIRRHERARGGYHPGARCRREVAPPARAPPYGLRGTRSLPVLLGPSARHAEPDGPRDRGTPVAGGVLLERRTLWLEVSGPAPSASASSTSPSPSARPPRRSI